MSQSGMGADAAGAGAGARAARVGMVGLGIMGLGMARTLLREGFTVTGVDPSAARCALAEEAGATIADAREAMAQPIVVASLPTAAHVEEVVAHFLDAAPAGAVFVDTSTSEAGTSRRLAERCNAKGLGFLDAPVSGGPAGAQGGALTIMVGGAADHVERARAVLDAMAAPDRVIHVGPPGAGNVAKLVNQMLLASHLIAAAEAMRMAEAAGVPAADVLGVVNGATGRSGATELNYPRWILNDAFDSGFTMGLMRKDVRLAAALAQEAGVPLPFAKAVAAHWAASADHLADGEDFNRIVQLAGSPA